MPLYAGGSQTGSYTVTYTPLVRGTHLTVQRPRIAEVQTVTTSALSESSPVSLKVQGGLTSDIDFDAADSVIKSAIEGACGCVVDVTVNTVESHGAADWQIKFVDIDGDVPTIGATNSLTGNAAAVAIDETTKGVELSISFPIHSRGRARCR